MDEKKRSWWSLWLHVNIKKSCIEIATTVIRFNRNFCLNLHSDYGDSLPWCQISKILHIVLFIFFPKNIKNLYNSSNFLYISFHSWYSIHDQQKIIFLVEKVLSCCSHSNPDSLGLRAKGEIIIMMSERLRKRTKAILFMWPLRKLFVPWRPTAEVPRQVRVMLHVLLQFCN
jgi:hypothetical protein